MINQTRNRIVSLLEEAYALRGKNPEHSKALTGEALAMSRDIMDQSLVAKSLSQLALFHMINGEYDVSAAMSEEAIRLFEELGDERGIADAKYNIAGIYYKTNNYHLGLIYLIDCLDIYRKYEDHHNQSRTEKSLGTIYEYFGDQNNAVKSYNNAIEATIRAGDLNLESNAYNPLSGIYLKQGRLAEAYEIIERSIQMKRQTGDVRGLAFALYGRAKANIKTGAFEQAEKDLKAAMDIHEEMGERLGMGMAYCKLAILHIETGRLEEAKEILFRAIEFSSLYRIAIIRFKCYYQLYRAYKLSGDPLRSLEFMERYLKEKEEVINTQTLKVIENYELIKQMESLKHESRMQREKAEIIAKKEQAEEAARMKQEFLAAMSHEIRTPLNAMLTTASLLRQRSDSEESQLLDSLRFSADHLLMIVNDIIDFTRLDSGKVQPEMKTGSIGSLVKRMREQFEARAEQNGLRFIVQTDGGLADAYEFDMDRLAQMLGKLLDNAIKFSDDGEIVLGICKLEEEDETDLLRFSVSDQGEGIDADKLEDIFGSFSLSRAVTTRRQGGTGLGLAIVRKMAALFKSSVNVESSPGEGATFSFDLRLKRTFIQSSDTDMQQWLKEKKCLLAEDNEINAMVARKILGRMGVVTEHARNGVEAVEKAWLEPYDFILMDLHMPEMNGFDATAEIRTNKNPNSSTPIFALTADITAKDREEYISYFTDFIWKPLEISRLTEALAHAQHV